ncbi:MAG: hypothetical protein KDC79_08505 [Cyclobacteriaceae bacterium]|nr:hypothetical protein [Cyclobacteriaceae bacterium]
MARQKGIIKLQGTIGDVSFYKSQDGFLARQKGGVDKERIKNDPAFQRTRENGSEFGRAGKAGRMLRTALRLMVQNASDSKVASRLTKEMLKVVKSDETNVRGARKVNEGDLSLLEGFDFNVNGKLSATLYSQYGITFDRAAGTTSIDFADFIPANTIAFPSGATHMKLLAGVAEIDFVNERFKFTQEESAEMPIDQNVVAGLSLAPGFTAGSQDEVFLVLGIDFMQEVNGDMYPLKNGAYNPLTIIKVDKA